MLCRETETPRAAARRARRFPDVLTRPGVLLAAALLVHVIGRLAAFCAPVKVDSLVYSIAAYRLYDAQITIDDLVPDKPPGQALMTGWAYLLAPGPPTRLALLPVESAFMVAGYVVFWLLARRLCGGHLAAAMTLCLVIAFNTYNALNITTDGFNLGENYLLAPMLLAVLGHLGIQTAILDRRLRAGRRRSSAVESAKGLLSGGLVRGLGVGVALTVKQTAVTLVVAFMLHELALAVVRREWRERLTAGLWTAVGVTIAWLPVLVFLWWRGWLGEHLDDLRRASGGHLAVMPIRWPPWSNVAPLLPGLWWVVVGAAGWLARPRLSDSAGCAGGTAGALTFMLLWVAVEVPLLWAMNKPGTHYYQPIVAPVLLTGGLALAGLHRRLERVGRLKRLRVERWLAATTAVVAMLASLPLLAEASKRRHKFDYQAEVRDFAHWLETWSPSQAAIHLDKGKR